MILTILFSMQQLVGLAAPMPADSVAPVHRAAGIGVLAGAHLSIMDQQDFRTAPGPVLGLYFYRDLSTSTTIQIELHGKIVPKQNLKAEFIDTLVTPGGIGTSRVELLARTIRYLEIPVLVRLRRDRSAHWTFFTGIRPSWNHIKDVTGSSYSTTSHSGVTANDYKDLNIRQGIHRFGLGLTAGCAYALSRHLRLDLRYTQGLFDLTADNFFKNNSNTLNSDLQLTLRANF